MAVDKLSALVNEQNEGMSLPPVGGGAEDEYEEMPEDEEESGEEEEEGEESEEGGSVEALLADLISEMMEEGYLEDDKLADLVTEWLALKEEAAAAEEAGEEAPEGFSNPPKWASNPAIWDRAEKIVDPEGEGAKYSEPYAVVANIYKRMGGGVS